MSEDQQDRHMTAESLKGLREEIERLKTEERPKIAAAIGTAAQEGDLSENAEYHAAREEQGHLEAKITRLEDQERSAIVITASPKERLSTTALPSPSKTARLVGCRPSVSSPPMKLTRQTAHFLHPHLWPWPSRP